MISRSHANDARAGGPPLPAALPRAGTATFVGQRRHEPGAAVSPVGEVEPLRDGVGLGHPWFRAPPWLTKHFPGLGCTLSPREPQIGAQPHDAGWWGG